LGPSTKPPFQGSVLLRWTLTVLLLSGALVAGEPFVDHLGYLALNGTVLISALTLVAASLFRTSRYRVPASVKVCLWGAAGNLGAIGFSIYCAVVYHNVRVQITKKVAKSSVQAFDSLALARWFSHVGIHDYQGIFWIFVILGIISMILACIGLPAALKKIAPKKSAVPPPLPFAQKAAGTD
jgi:hypothetical protein